MKVLKQESRNLPEPHENGVLQGGVERLARTHAPHPKVQPAGSARYEDHMQELAAEFQSLVSTETE